MVSLVEQGEANVSVDLAGRLISALGTTLELRHSVPFGGTQQADAGHSQCVAYVQRRLEREGWTVQREVEVGRDRWLGWIDILARQASDGTLLVIEVKTELRDLGDIERTMGWYVREARSAAAALGWPASSEICRWLLLLSTQVNDRRVIENSAALRQSFPGRPGAEARLDRAPSGLAMIDPRSRRRRWLIGTWADGRRTPTPYADYRDFVVRSLRR